MRKTILVIAALAFALAPFGFAEAQHVNCRFPSTLCSSVKFTSTAPASTNAISLTASQRISFGSGTDYLYGDNTNVWSGGPFSVGSILYVGSDIRNLNSTPVRVNDATGLSLEGVATASLATCDNVAPVSGGNRGVIQYDLTTRTYKWCNGTSWQEFANSSAILTHVATFGGFSPPVAEEVDFVQTRATWTGQITGVDFTVTTVGAGAVANGTLTITNETAATSCTLAVSCTAAAGTTTNGACALDVSSGQVVSVKWALAGECGTNPAGNVVVAFRKTS